MHYGERSQLRHPEPELGQPEQTEHQPQAVREPAPARSGGRREHLVADTGPRGHGAQPGQPGQPGQRRGGLRPSGALRARGDVRVHRGPLGQVILAVEPGRQRFPTLRTLHVDIVAQSGQEVPAGTRVGWVRRPPMASLTCRHVRSPRRRGDPPRAGRQGWRRRRPRPPSSRPPRPDVRRFLAHLADAGDVEDLSQETYLRAMGALRRFDARASARTWLLLDRPPGGRRSRPAGDAPAPAVARARLGARPRTAGTW